MAVSYDDAPNPVPTKVTAGEEEEKYDDEGEEGRGPTHEGT